MMGGWCINDLSEKVQGWDYSYCPTFIGKKFAYTGVESDCDCIVVVYLKEADDSKFNFLVFLETYHDDEEDNESVVEIDFKTLERIVEDIQQYTNGITDDN